MTDYGFKVSADGFDVKTCDDKDTVVTSKYPNLKGALSGSGSIAVAQDASIDTVTIAHGLGYVPMVQAFARDDDGDFFNTYYYPMAIFDIIDTGSITAAIEWIAKADSTNVYLTFYYEVIFGTPGAAVDISYQYRIFLDKGDL